MNNFERLDMYPHNIETSKKIMKAFTLGEDTVSIIHATGTGKSYNALYLVLENKDKKIVWLVPTLAIKEHIETTINNNPNMNLTKDFSNLEIKTYTSFINMTKEEIKAIPCDLLIVDELHHLGAPVWGKRVETFVKTHPNMKKFGMTAYTVRDRGTIYERDMTNLDTDEIFSNTITSVYDLYDAMIDGILPKPITRTVITENSELIVEIREKIEMLKRKNDPSYIEYEKILTDIVKVIHKQNGIKELVQQTIIPGGKYIYFCPVQTEEGKNDISTIMQTMKDYVKEKFPAQNIVFYKSTSSDGEEGKYNRECFYYDRDLEGKNATNAIKIIFVKNQYNEGVHAPNVDGVFLGRRTRSDIVAFEQIGRALSVRGNIQDQIEKYNLYNLEELKQLAISRGLSIKEPKTKEQVIEKLISPVIIDLADNIEFIEELETNLGDRVKEIQKQGSRHKRIIKISDISFDIEVMNKDLLNILKKVRENLKSRTWYDWYHLAVSYYNYHGNSEIPAIFKTKNGYEYDANGVLLGAWCYKQRKNYENLPEERRKKLKTIGFQLKKIRKTIMNWDDWYNLAVAYYNYHGNFDIPARFKTKNGYEYDEEGINLGLWNHRQRKNYETLTEDKKIKLDFIKFRTNQRKSRK